MIPATVAPTVDLQYTLTIPRHLADRFATPADLTAYLVQQGVWPARVMQERWRLGIEVPGWVVELTISAPLPQVLGDMP